MEKQLKEIEIPFGAKDSELCGWEYSIPEGMEATIVDNKIVIKKKDSEDEKTRKEITEFFKNYSEHGTWKAISNVTRWIAWLEKQGEKTEPIEGFNTEFERQISHLIASTINKEYEYTEDFVKWTSNALLNYAKHEFEKHGASVKSLYQDLKKLKG